MTLLKPTREPLSEQVFQWLLGEIQAGRWPVGTKLPAEAQLTTQIGVCRSTLREAVRGLIHAGILEARHGSGTYVLSTTGMESALKRRLDAAKAFEIMEVRRALEVQAAGLAAARGTDEDLDAMEAVLAQVHQAAEAGDMDGFIEHDLAFLRMLVASTRNRLLIDLYRDLEASHLELLRDTAVHAPFEAVRRGIHAPMMAAVRARDVAAAEQAARVHLDRVIAVFEAGDAL